MSGWQIQTAELTGAFGPVTLSACVDGNVVAISLRVGTEQSCRSDHIGLRDTKHIRTGAAKNNRLDACLRQESLHMIACGHSPSTGADRNHDSSVAQVKLSQRCAYGLPCTPPAKQTDHSPNGEQRNRYNRLQAISRKPKQSHAGEDAEQP